jgi:hypothetical protein
VFDGPVSLSEGPAARLSQAVADSGVKAKADKKKRRLAADRSQRRA